MKRVLLGMLIVAAYVMVSVSDALAQRAGQMASIRYGTVVDMLSLILSADQTIGYQSAPKAYRTKVQYRPMWKWGSFRPRFVDARSTKR